MVRSVRPTSYVLRNDGTVTELLRSWKLLASRNGTTWTTLDTHTNENEKARASVIFSYLGCGFARASTTLLRVSWVRQPQKSCIALER